MKQEKILIVENESIIARDLEISLKRLGWPHSDIAYSGPEAVEKTRSFHPDVILMDIKLGKEMDGIEAAGLISVFSDVPIIYITAYADEETLARAKITQPFGYIVKPIEERNLHATIEMGLYKHRVEKQLREKDKWLGMIVGNLNEGLIATDSEGAVQLMNPAAEFYTGRARAGAMGRHYSEVLEAVNDLTGEPVSIPLCESLERETTVELAENTLLKSLNGNTITIEGKCIPVLNEDGRITGSMLVFHDVTRRKQLENQLSQTRKMEALGTLAGGIAHDFNNLISGIMGHTEISLRKLEPDSAVEKSIRQVLFAARRARDLVKQILTFSRQSKECKTRVHVSRIIGETIDLLRPTLPSHIEIRQNITAEDALVTADPTQVHQVLMNLSTNALQAMQETGGLLEIKLDRITIAPNVEPRVHPGTELCVTGARGALIDTIKPGSYLRLCVRDTGKGMDSTVMGRIFEPYFTTRAGEEGTGMGLAVVHGIIKKHHGYINVESTPGRGTKFEILLPPAEQPTQPPVRSTAKNNQINDTGQTESVSTSRLKVPDYADEVAAEAETDRRHKGRILLVDDEPEMVEIGRDLLENLGYSVVGRTNPETAFNDFGSAPRRFDLVILDDAMPRMPGVRLAAKLMKIRPDIPVILCTGFSRVKKLKGLCATGIRAVVMKPIIAGEIANVLNEIMNNDSCPDGNAGGPNNKDNPDEANHHPTIEAAKKNFWWGDELPSAMGRPHHLQ